MLHKADNLLKSMYHDLAASMDGKIKRQQRLAQRERRGASHTKNYQQHAAIQNRVSKIDLGDEQSVAEGVKDVGERIKTIPDSGGKWRTFSVRGKMLNRLEKSYIGGKIASLIRAKLDQMQEEEEAEMNEAQNVVIEKKKEGINEAALDEAAKRKARWEAKAKRAKTAGR